MFYHPFLRSLLLFIGITVVLSILRRVSIGHWSSRVFITVAFIPIIGIASLLSLQEIANSSSISTQTLELKHDELGFKELSPGQNPLIDIIAIHGLDGHRERSWTAENGTMWLRDLLPLDIPSARILTYGYDSDTRRFTHTSTQGIFHHAEAFVVDLTLARIANPERPIIFLAHSLGGIILKKALALCHGASYGSDHRYIKVSTYAILFFGTPHSGANGVDLAQWMAKLLSVYMFTDDTIVKGLDQNSSELQSIQAFYLGASEHIKSIFFYERLPTRLMKGVAELIVPRRLAIIEGDRNAEIVGLDRDHCEMVKFAGKHENDYRRVAGYLSRLVREAPSETERHWYQERRHRSIADGEVEANPQVVLPKARLPVSRNYVHRPHIQDFFTEKLLSSGNSGIQARCILHGLGGSGKTQVASFWIEANKDKFTNIIFLDASSQKQIEADLETAIRSIGLGWSKATWKDAVAYLSLEKRWLLFFDNADAPELRLEDYLPTSTSGAILITTRNRDFLSYAPDSHIQVDKMSETEAVDLLHKVANVYPSSNGTSVAVVRELGMLALAITQAGAYIFKTGDLGQYLAIFRKHRAELMRETSLKGRNYDSSTYTAFDMSFGLLPKKSQEFMKICAFLHHSHIPQALFKRSIDNNFLSFYDVEGYSPVPGTETLISDLRSTFGSEWDEFVFHKLVDPIWQGSLIDRSTDDHKHIFFNIHPLLQKYLQDLLILADQNYYALSTGQLLLSGIRSFEYDDKWNHELLPHVHNLPTRVKQAHFLQEMIFAGVYQAAGSWCASLGILEHCDIQHSNEFGRCDYITACMRTNPGMDLDMCAELEEAERLEREVLKSQDEIHPMKSAMERIARILDNHGQFEEAENVQRKTLELRRAILGPRHPDTIAIMYDIARTFIERGQIEGAEKMMREVLELRREALGPRDPRTISAMQDIALTLCSRGQLEEAEGILREALELQAETSEPRHTSTIVTMHNLALTLYGHGQFEEAEKIQWEVVGFFEGTRGRRHYDTMGAMHVLALILCRRRQLEEAEKILREVLSHHTEVLGRQHPQTVMSMEHLSQVLRGRGRLEEAEEMEQEIVVLRRDSGL
ncbi:hypothetical protein CPB86DRAFT_878527 [Serendipita vermifera]|nr:hypothetical protein CPB86DRAFT_878527 [Serendipita vermifera]